MINIRIDNTTLRSHRRFDEIYKELNGLRSRIDIVERAATAHVEDRKYYIVLYRSSLDDMTQSALWGVDHAEFQNVKTNSSRAVTNR